MPATVRADMGRTEPTTFIGGSGEPLAGVLHHPDQQPVGAALLAHCFSCSKDLHTSTRLARSLADAGYLTLRFDFTGLGESGGEFASTTVSGNVRDLTRAAVAMIERDVGPCVLVGHSLGGAAAVLTAARLHTVRQVVAIASPSSVGHVRGLFDAGEEERVRRDGAATVSIGGRPFELGATFLDDLDRHDVLTAAASLARPFLVVDAGADTVVPATETEALAAAGGATRHTVAGADHLFSHRTAAAELASVIVDWLAHTG